MTPELSKRIGDAISTALLLGFAAGFIAGGLAAYMLFRTGVFT